MDAADVRRCCYKAEIKLIVKLYQQFIGNARCDGQRAHLKTLDATWLLFFSAHRRQRSNENVRKRLHSRA